MEDNKVRCEYFINGELKMEMKEEKEVLVQLLTFCYDIATKKRTNTKIKVLNSYGDVSKVLVTCNDRIGEEPKKLEWLYFNVPTTWGMIDSTIVRKKLEIIK